MISLEAMGDQAVLARFAQESDAGQFTAWIRSQNPTWLVDVVQAYQSVAVFFDLREIALNHVQTELAAFSLHETDTEAGHLFEIPCCYDLALDRERVCEVTKLSWPEIVTIHTSKIYTVFAIGFCPGFPYLGYLPEELSNVPRLDSPRQKVEAGSVGLTGRQTGIYTEARPGGWSIIGRTPLLLVNVEENYFPLRTGDRIQFVPIDRDRFEKLQGTRVKNEN